MSIHNAPTSYGWLTRALHWATAALMLPTLAIAAYMWTREENVPGDPQKYFAVLPWHKTLGFLVLVVLVVRLPWYLRSVRPDPPPGTSPATARAATWVHAALYALMIALPVLGYVGSSAGPGTFKLFTLWEMPRLVGRDQALSSAIYDVHAWLGWTAAVLVAGHIGAAIWHQWIRRDGALRRMWPPTDGRRAAGGG